MSKTPFKLATGLAAALLATGLAAALLATTAAHATTLTTSLSAFEAGIGGNIVTATGTSGAFDTTGFQLPTTNVIPLNDGTNLGLANFDQVEQSPDGNGGYAFHVSGGYAGDLFTPEDSNGNAVKSETITLSNGQNALGFYILPNSNSATSASSTITATLSNGTTTSFTLASANLNTGTATPDFIGFFGGGISALTITTSDADGFTFGEFQDVPEPASAAILAVGLAAAGWRKRSVRKGA